MLANVLKPAVPESNVVANVNAPGICAEVHIKPSKCWENTEAGLPIMQVYTAQVDQDMVMVAQPQNQTKAAGS